MNKETFYNLLKRIPKTEIHLHSEALISKKTAAEILSRSNPKYKDKKVLNKLVVTYCVIKGCAQASPWENFLLDKANLCGILYIEEDKYVYM